MNPFLSVMRLAPYQHRWLIDRSPRKVFVKSRRIGGSFVVALENAWGAAGVGFDSRGQMYYRPERGCDQRIISASMLQAVELLAETRRHLEALSIIVGKALIAQSSVTQITLRNGAKLMALPANPATIRGGPGADVTLDEFGAMPHVDDVWAAAKAKTDATLGRPFGFRLRIVGTPLGDDNKFYRLAKTQEGKRFSVHSVDIHQAVREGFPADIESLREEIGDADIFSQEYECQFVSASSRYISAALYESCMFGEDEFPATAYASIYSGFDVGRRAHGDPSAIVRLAKIGDTLWHRSTELRRGVEFNAQELWAEEEIRTSSRLAIDATGLGMDLAERLSKKHTTRVEPIEFTLKNKEVLATGLFGAMSNKKLRVMRDDAEMRRSVLSIRKNITAKGNTTYDAERTKKGHADAGWALALAVHTAGGPDPTKLKVRVLGDRTTNQLNKSW